MKKRLFTAVLSVFLILSLCSALFSCTVDLSHKHYYNSIGACGVCGYSISIPLEYNEYDGTYSAEVGVEAVPPSDNGCYYFNFLPHGESKVAFSITGNPEIEIDRIDVYLSAANHMGTPLLKNGLLEYTLSSQSIIYLQVRFEGGAGAVKFRVNNLLEG